MSEYDPNTKQVNGPVNVVRLEGTVSGINKVIYLFMDFHMNPQSQTQCDNLFSDDVSKYFAKSFHQLNKEKLTYDFFLEAYPSELSDKERHGYILRSHMRENYIEEVVKFFKKIFRYDPSKNKVSVSDYIKNVRFHYIDIRDYIKLFKYQLSDINTILEKSNCHNYITDIDILYVIDILHFIKEIIIFVNDVLNQKENMTYVFEPLNQPTDHNKNTLKLPVIPTSMEQTKFPLIFKYFINKILTSYKNSTVKKILIANLNNIKKEFEQLNTDIGNMITNCTEYQKILAQPPVLTFDNRAIYKYHYGIPQYIVRDIIKNMQDQYELIDEKIVIYFARLIDIYFLRRFLDKDYITNAIVYTGALHSCNYVSILVKSFDFKVTHVSYSKIPDLKKLMTEIKKKPWDEISGLLWPPVLQQCSDMSTFPEKFT